MNPRRSWPTRLNISSSLPIACIPGWNMAGRVVSPTGAHWKAAGSRFRQARLAGCLQGVLQSLIRLRHLSAPCGSRHTSSAQCSAAAHSGRLRLCYPKLLLQCRRCFHLAVAAHCGRCSPSCQSLRLCVLPACTCFLANPMSKFFEEPSGRKLCLICSRR